MEKSLFCIGAWGKVVWDGDISISMPKMSVSLTFITYFSFFLLLYTYWYNIVVLCYLYACT